MLRETFHREMRELEVDLIRMGEMVEKAIGQAVEAIKNRDMNLARQIIVADDQIDERQYSLEERALILIATQQPLASDLRTIASIISVANELERMGDYAEGIATITLRSADQPCLEPFRAVPRMAATACQMLHGSLEAFVARDLAWAEGISGRDDEVDALYNQVSEQLLACMTQDPSTITEATYLLWVAHNLERIADRTTNICERIVFMVTGRQQDLNFGTIKPTGAQPA